MCVNVKKSGNELPIVLPQVTMNDVSNVAQNEILNVFVGNEHGIALAQTGLRRSFLGGLKNRGESY
jgi:antitoxin component of MazEF toxin-antitoxin module